MPRSCAPQQEKPLQWEACALQRRVAPTCHNQRKPVRTNEDPMQQKIKKIKIKIKESWNKNVGGSLEDKVEKISQKDEKMIRKKW